MPINVLIHNFPKGSSYITNPAIKGNPTFTRNIKFPLRNGDNINEKYQNGGLIGNNFPLIPSLTINGNTYTNVRKYLSNSTVVKIPNATLPYRPRNVHVLYYHAKLGILGFDDLDGKSWRL